MTGGAAKRRRPRMPGTGTARDDARRARPAGAAAAAKTAPPGQTRLRPPASAPPASPPPAGPATSSPPAGPSVSSPPAGGLSPPADGLIPARRTRRLIPGRWRRRIRPGRSVGPAQQAHRRCSMTPTSATSRARSATSSSATRSSGGPQAQADHVPGHRRARADRDGRGQRRGRRIDLCAGWPELRLQPAVDAAAADPGADRQPGDGGPARRGHRRRARPADQRAVRPVLGLVQRRRPVHPELPDHRHRIHRCLARAAVFPRLPRTSRCRSPRSC